MNSAAEKTSQPSTVVQQKAQQRAFFRKAKEESFFGGAQVQPKLNIGQRGDKYEQQADAMADKVVRKNAKPSPAVSSKASEEKIDKKEEEQKQEEGAVQRKPMFESESEPDVQRAIYPENDEGEKVFRSENETPAGSLSKGESIVAIARSKIGKVRAKEGLPGDGGKQVRYGCETLLEIFHLAAPGVWPDEVVKNLGDGLPSWCGIFAVYCIKKSGIDIGTWQMGKGVSAFGKLKQTNSPQAGDIAYMDAHQHHAIVVKVEGDIVHSIDGNSGLRSEIIENQRPRKAYRGFFTALQNEVTSGGDVQKKEDSGNSTEASPSIESRINASKGDGNTLDDSTRSEMESGFGNDFGGVRIHTGSEAHQMSKDLNAQAFTHGQDIYFDQGKYNPQTAPGKHLLAHELTHTVQQSGALSRKSVQRVPGNSGSSAKDPVLDSSTSPQTIVFPEIQLPAFKSFSQTLIGENLERIAAYKRKDAYEIHEGDESDERKKPQAILWMDNVRPDVKLVIEKKTKEKDAVSKAVNGKTVFYFNQSFGKGGSQNLFGTVDDLVENSIIPKWTKNGQATAFDVDHIKELQLGGQNEIQNMELVQFSANRSSGAAIATQVESKAAEVVTKKKIKNKSSDEEVEIKGSVEDIKKKYNLKFTKVKYNLGAYKADENMRWTASQIKSGDQLKKLKPLSNPDELNGKKGDEIIYTSEIGGRKIKISKLEKLAKKDDSIKLTKGSFKDDHENSPTGDEIGNLNAEFGSYGSKMQPKTIHIPIYKMDGVIHGGGIKRKGQSGKGGLEQLLVGFDLEGMSPIKIDQADIDENKGLYARGRIVPTLNIIKGVEIDFYIDKDEIRLSKTFSSGDLSDKFPKPFVLNSAAITVSMGNKGYKVEGDIFFEITNVGTGHVKGTAKDDGDFGIAGSFDFDPKLFKGKVKQAGIKAEYGRKDGWKIEGDLTIADKAVKGIKSGNIHVAYTNEILKAEGTAETTIKGVKEVRLKIVFGKDVFEIEGGVKIEKLPGIKEGEGTLKIAKKDNEYDFSGKGKMTPDIPGIDTQVDFEFLNEIFTVDASLQYKRDRLEGKLTLGITNQVMTAGVPSGKKSDTYTVYGGGQVSLKITDTLKVTAGVSFLANGEVEVTGRIDLPKKFDLFPAPLPKRKKQLLKVPVNIPTPIPIIQIYVYGYIDAEAEIGGGYLGDVFAEVKYNPSHPEEMSITGGMSFNMPAYAQVKAGVEFGVKASLLIASIRGGIDLSAALRLDVPQPLVKGELKWSPANGFELDGVAKTGIMPSLNFSGAFKITGEIDLLLGSISKSWEWPFGSMTLSPNAPFGMEFPFKYNKNTPLNLSFDQIKFNYPSVSQLADSLKDSVVNKINDKLG